MHSQSLFYPASGYDTQIVFKLFPAMNEYWFVDYKYRNMLPRSTPPFDKMFPLLLPSSVTLLNYPQIITINDVKLPSRAETNQLLHFKYECKKEDNMLLSVNFIAGDALAAFYHFFISTNKKLDVFFYRNDGMGEGGSGITWFKKKLFRELLSALTSNNTEGMLVTDGSNYSDFPRLSIHSLNSTFNFKQYKVEFLKRDNEELINYWLVENTDLMMINKK